MGTITITAGDDNEELPLSSSMRLGRHWSNDVVLRPEVVPLSWLELRWRAPNWCWRALSAVDRTRGSGAAHDEGWRIWTGRSGHVRLDGGQTPVEVRLVDPSPPELVVERITRPGRFAGLAAERFVEQWPDGRVWPLGSEPTIDPPLRDGQVFVREADAYRVHLPSELSDTAPLAFDLRHDDIELNLDLARLHASFEIGQREAVVTGECVRVLAVYALARRGDGDAGGGGWVGAQAAHEHWVELAGRAESPVDRLAWERGKLRTQLARQGVVGLEQLFEVRRVSGYAEVRLAIPPARITVVDVWPRT